MPATTAPQKKTTRLIQKGRVYIKATFNNTLVTITDENGNTLCWGSTGNSDSPVQGNPLPMPQQ